MLIDTLKSHVSIKCLDITENIVLLFKHIIDLLYYIMFSSLVLRITFTTSDNGMF